MKRAFSVLLLVMITVFQTQGQDISLGIVGGGNLSTLNLENTEYRPGYQLGGYAEMAIIPRLTIQTELLYSVQQANVQNSLLSQEYVLIPFLAKIKLNKIVNLQIGPQYGMLISSSASSEAEEIQSYKSKNISFALGVGVDLPMGFSTSMRFANAIDGSFSNIGEVTSDVVQLSIAVDLIRLSHTKY